MTQPKLRFQREDGMEFPEWEEKSIKEIAPLQRGFDLPEKERVNGEYPVVCSNGIVAYHNQYKCEGYAVITGRSGTIGNFTYLDKCRYWAHNTSLWVTDFCGNNPKFIYYFYHTIRIEQYSTGTGVPTLNRNNVHASRHYVPCLEEQQKIADFLSTIDEVIAQSEAEVQNLEQQKKAAMRKIFLQEVRFKREDGTEFPEWEDCVLSDYCQELKVTIDPKKRPNDSFLEYSMPAFDLDKRPSKVVGNDMNSSRKVINTCCVLINKLNVRKKRVWKITNPEDNSVCSAEFIPVTSDTINLDYLEHLALSDRFTARLLDCSTGTSNSQKRVTPDIIMDMPVSIPCLEEQQKIANFFSAYDEAIACAKQELDKWKELKKGLLQQMFV